MIGVEATVIGFGLRGVGFGFGAGFGTEVSVIVTTGSGVGSVGLSADFSSALLPVSALSVFSADFSSGLVSADFPKTSAVVAAASSRAGITMPSSAGAGSFTGSGGADFFPLGFAWGTLKSRTVGSGT